MTATGRPASDPRCSSPAWLSTVDTGKWGIFRYGITVSGLSVSAKSPSPVPRMIPTSGRTEECPRTYPAASSTCVSSSLAMSPVPLHQRRLDALFDLGLRETFDLEHLGPRPLSPHQGH